MENGTRDHACHWTDCSQSFGSELDMGLHVITNHLNVLDYGQFVLNRRLASQGPEPRVSIEPIIVRHRAQPIKVEPTASNSENTAQVEAQPQPIRKEPETLALEGTPARRGRGRLPRIKSPNPSTAPPAPRSHKIAQPVGNRSPRPQRKRQRTRAFDEDPDDRILLDMLTRRAPTFQAPRMLSLPAPPAPSNAQSSRAESSVSNGTGPLKKSEACRRILIRLYRPPLSNHRLFQTDHFCVLCQHNYTQPCTKRHRAEDLQVIEDWKRQFGHLQPVKKQLLAQLKQMAEQYDREEREEENGAFVAPAAPLAPRTRRLVPPGLARVLGDDDEEEQQPEPVREVKPAKIEQKDEEEDEKEKEPSTSDRSKSQRVVGTKMSKLCANLAYRIQMRQARFRATDRSQFCLNCISFKGCEREHTAGERRLDKTWQKYYGDASITPEKLVEQLEALKEKEIDKMSGPPEMIQCGWRECTSWFSSGRDMNEHVLVNHIKHFNIQLVDPQTATVHNKIQQNPETPSKNSPSVTIKQSYHAERRRRSHSHSLSALDQDQDASSVEQKPPLMDFQPSVPHFKCPTTITIPPRGEAASMNLKQPLEAQSDARKQEFHYENEDDDEVEEFNYEDNDLILENGGVDEGAPEAKQAKKGDEGKEKRPWGLASFRDATDMPNTDLRLRTSYATYGEMAAAIFRELLLRKTLRRRNPANGDYCVVCLDYKKASGVCSYRSHTNQHFAFYEAWKSNFNQENLNKRTLMDQLTEMKRISDALPANNDFI
ncbi:unnamed protein product [Caenorhabditis sp. 36 PRJEB53466]|nr:unnamed protein product [Caenorhabditis sp. 36 PRJEB53466]